MIDLTRQEKQQELLKCMDRMTSIMLPLRFRTRPIYGQVFGSGQYELGSIHSIKNGLDCLSFVVRHIASKGVVAYGDSQEDALGTAREIIQCFDAVQLGVFFGRLKSEQEAVEAAKRKAIQDAEHERWERNKKAAKVASIPRRRQRIFDESEGKCHYCATPLTLDGKWHIEHKMPKALMGGNEPSNLVASCVTCNHRKKDKTDVEFKAKLAAEAK